MLPLDAETDRLTELYDEQNKAGVKSEWKNNEPYLLLTESLHTAAVSQQLLNPSVAPQQLPHLKYAAISK